MLPAALQGLLRPIVNRLRGMMRRGTVSNVDEARKLREVQVQAGHQDLRDRVEHFEPYGFTSSPLEGAEAILATLGADRAHTVAVVIADRRHRLLGLSPGDVALYAAGGPKVILRKEGGVEITSQVPVTITAPELHVQGNITASGDVSDGVRSMAGDRQIFNLHTHPGVEPGSGITGPPTIFQATGDVPTDFALQVIEIPPMLLRGNARAMGVLRIRSGIEVEAAAVWISTDDVDYEKISDQSHFVTGGTLLGSLPNDTVDIENGPILHAAGPDFAELVRTLRTGDWEMGRQLLVVENEWMFLRDAVDLGGGDWQLVGIKRARYRSSAALHSPGAIAFIVDPRRLFPYYDPLVSDAQTVWVKSQPRSSTAVAALADVTPATTTFAVSGPNDPVFEYAEVPTGALDGVNPTFHLTYAPNPPQSLQLYVNVARMRYGVDFTVSGNTITFLPGAIPDEEDVVEAGLYQG